MSGTRIQAISVGWSDSLPPKATALATETLERGNVLFMRELTFSIEREEAALFTPAILSSSKNASYDSSSDRVTGTTLERVDLERLRQMMNRFSRTAAGLVGRLFPAYSGRIQVARASFRPAEIAGRRTSWRKDDTRLHIDSCPASPVQGQRILRVFTNVNPSGRCRTWRVGGEFEAVARRFVGRLSMPWPGTSRMLQAFRITRSRRTAYDALMLQLHDCMKEDSDFQQRSEQEIVDFPSGSSWIAFTDQVSHAATAGQYQLEQTFLLPVSAMRDERGSPLRVLEGLMGRRLV